MDRLRTPRWAGQVLSYRTRPREKRSFHSVLDAAELLPHDATTSITLDATGGVVALGISQPLRRGQLDERVEHVDDAGLRVRRLVRHIRDEVGGAARDETAEFSAKTHMLPDCTYVDVSIPFLLGEQPFDGKSRSLYAWICDRFVAKVYYESRGEHDVVVGAGRFATREVVMYPDLNDWVKLGTVLSKLAKPFLPKYHMFYEIAAPHRLVRFDGPHGPPGAPEITLELERSEPD